MMLVSCKTGLKVEIKPAERSYTPVLSEESAKDKSQLVSCLGEGAGLINIRCQSVGTDPDSLGLRGSWFTCQDNGDFEEGRSPFADRWQSYLSLPCGEL